jgi:dTDP-4-amino-4,6-dideoxygalactose transaminase
MIKLPPPAIAFFKQNLEEIFESGQLAEGKWNESFGKLICEYCGTQYAIPTVSNGSGITALLQIYKRYYGRNNVLLQSNTMYGLKTMVGSAGCNLLGYVPCQLATLMPALDQVRAALREFKESKPILILSHIGGIVNPDMPEIATLCREEGVVLVEDCAHSYGAHHDGRHSGTFGDAGVYSFYATKAIPGGEGGVVVTNNLEIGDLVKRYAIYDRFDQKMDIGVNIRPSEIQALLLYSVVKEAEEIISNKAEIAQKYIEACSELSITFIEQQSDKRRGNYYKFVLLSESLPARQRFVELNTLTSAVYDYDLSGSSDEISEGHLCLPIWYDQPEQTTDQVIDELRACCS